MYLFFVFVACAYANVAFVWQANDQAGDHVAQVDVRPSSPTFGQVLSRTFLPPYASIARTGNEPHHVGVSGDRRYLVTAGLGSFLAGKDQVFVFNLNPSDLFQAPTFAYSLNVPGYGCPDEFVPFGRQQLLLTMMCNSAGQAPGALFLLDLSKKSISLWTRGVVGSPETFNPHGADSSARYGVIAADYIQPISLFSPPPFTFRDTLHHFWPNGSYAGLINLPTTNGGFMDFRFTDRWGQTRYGITSSSTTNILYRIDALNHNDVRPLIDLSKVVGGAPVNSGGIMRFSFTGTRFIMTFQFRYVLLIEFTPDLSRANVIQVFDFCKNVDPTKSKINFPKVCADSGNTPGTHYIVFSPLEDRFLVTNYFIRVGNVQTIQSGMHLFKVSYFSGWSLKDLFQIKSFSYEYGFQPDLSVNGAQSYPHGVAYLRGWHRSPDDDDDGIGN